MRPKSEVCGGSGPSWGSSPKGDLPKLEGRPKYWTGVTLEGWVKHKGCCLSRLGALGCQRPLGVVGTDGLAWGVSPQAFAYLYLIGTTAPTTGAQSAVCSAQCAVRSAQYAVRSLST
jgi:hypothetical protein